ncbi:MAG: ABC transporter substrate-binding protein [Acidisphaera sp.]|nr:ABC transporter substrate-binding protein [Acidisphaera sp.]
MLPAAAFAQACQPQLGAPPLVHAGELATAINPTVAPIQYIDENGNLVGLDVDFGNMIAARLCLKMNFISTQFATMIPSLKEGRFDMIDTFMYYTPERAAQVLMIPYGAGTLAIVVPADNKDAIADLAYFSGKRFGAQLGSIDEKTVREASDALVKSGKPPIDVRSFPNYSDVLQTLSAGQIDGGFVGTEQAYYYRKKSVGFFRIALTGLYPHTEALAFSQHPVADRVVDALNAMHADGSFAKLFGAYHHCTLPPPYRITTGPLDPPTCPAQPE